MGMQATLENGTQLSLGQYPIAREDSDSLLTLTMSLLHEIASVGEPVGDQGQLQQRDECVKTILGNMVSTMTDRARVMKSTNQKLSDMKKELTGEGEGLHSLFCNAHVLLGMSAETSKS